MCFDVKIAIIRYKSSEMGSTKEDDDILEELEQDFLINYPIEVQKAIEQILPSDDPLDRPDFNTIDYINSLFPTEQSLSNIDEAVAKMERKIATVDEEISNVVRGQTTASQDGRQALDEAQRVIRELFLQVKDIKGRAAKSEEMVREITHDIKQLDCAKRNLTLAITTLNHLDMLVGGVDTLKRLTEKRLYGEIALPLEAINEVMTHFQHYGDIEQIKGLSDQVRVIQADLEQQITHDFKQAFATSNAKGVGQEQLAAACLVVSILEPRVKRNLLKWFIGLQLQEYSHLFDGTEDTAWLDKIDKRYAWLKRHLLEFEERRGTLFPPNWEVSERIAVQFCHLTRTSLTNIMARRKHEIDIKLLLYAIQKTTNFESLLNRRFTGITLKEEADSDAHDFTALISACFIPYLYLYIENVDRNLADLLERFQQESKQLVMTESTETQASVLPSCADLFVFYKKCMVQCTQLSNGPIMLELTQTFQKYLRDYCAKILAHNLPKIDVQSSTLSLGSSVQSLTRDLQKISTSGLIQNFSSLLKEGDAVRLSSDEVSTICCILTTAEYCLETTKQLEEKLREKTIAALADKINMATEQDQFHAIIASCIQMLVQDLENACEPALTAMAKVQWQHIVDVEDQSAYVTALIGHFKGAIPAIRDHLAHSLKYFTQFCNKFVAAFIPKFTGTLYKCRPLSTEGAEQLLLDTHILKTSLLTLPSIGTQTQRAAPPIYTKVVNKGMTKAEMILKVAMTPVEPAKAFVEQYVKLLPECQVNEFGKMLELKSVRKQEQTALVELFKTYRPGGGATGRGVADRQEGGSGGVQEAGRIKKLERLIKMGIPK